MTAAAPLLGFDLPPDRLRAVADAFAVVLRVAEPALALDVPADTEPAPLFRA